MKAFVLKRRHQKAKEKAKSAKLHPLAFFENFCTR
jgi:hypothetical protein